MMEGAGLSSSLVGCRGQSTAVPDPSRASTVCPTGTYRGGPLLVVHVFCRKANLIETRHAKESRVCGCRESSVLMLDTMIFLGRPPCPPSFSTIQREPIRRCRKNFKTPLLDRQDGILKQIATPRVRIRKGGPTKGKKGRYISPGCHGDGGLGLFPSQRQAGAAVARWFPAPHRLSAHILSPSSDWPAHPLLKAVCSIAVMTVSPQALMPPCLSDVPAVFLGDSLWPWLHFTFPASVGRPPRPRGKVSIGNSWGTSRWPAGLRSRLPGLPSSAVAPTMCETTQWPCLRRTGDDGLRLARRVKLSWTPCVKMKPGDGVPYHDGRL